MRNRFLSVSALFLALATVFLCACGDTKKGGGNAPRGDSADSASSLISYDFSQDSPFLPKDIFDRSMFVNGLVPTKEDGKYYIDVRGSDDSAQAIVFPAEFGKCYEIKFPLGLSGLRAAAVDGDPRNAAAGSKIDYTDSLQYYTVKPGDTEKVSFMYVCRKENQYVVLYTGTHTPNIMILERTMIQNEDTEGYWFTPPAIGSIRGQTGKGKGTFADYLWSSEELYKNIYEPLTEKYPEYITKEYLGNDQSGQYYMNGYVFEPESYKACLFITSGMHGNEQTAYFALAAFMQLVADATEDGDPLLWFLRCNVKFVVVPLINVWSASEDHIRYNSTGMDLNHDWVEYTQKETKNVLWFFKKHMADIDIAMDFHNASSKERSLYYNFINFTPNAVANYKSTNHMYHRFMEEGILTKSPNLVQIPGSYKKSNLCIEGRIWNDYKIPTITIEHANWATTDKRWGSGDEMTLAVETFGNFIIQNALFFSQEQ